MFEGLKKSTIDKVLKSMVGAPILYSSVSGNSIDIGFLINDDEEVVLWVHPIWELSKNGELFSASLDFEDINMSKDEHTNLAKRVNHLKSEKLVDFEIHYDEGNVLTLVFSNNFNLVTFNNGELEDENEEEWTIHMVKKRKILCVNRDKLCIEQVEEN